MDKKAAGGEDEEDEEASSSEEEEAGQNNMDGAIEHDSTATVLKKQRIDLAKFKVAL